MLRSSNSSNNRVFEPELSDKSVASWNATFTCDEIILFERIKKCCGHRLTYENFMRCIRLFTEGVYTPYELIEQASIFLRNAPKVLDEFVKLIRFCEPDDETECNRYSNQRLAKELNALCVLDCDAHSQIEQVIHDIDFATRRALSMSYRCAVSDRNDEVMADTLLNDIWMCFPSTNVNDSEELAVQEPTDEARLARNQTHDLSASPPPFSAAYSSKSTSSVAIAGESDHRDSGKGVLSRFQSTLASPLANRYAILNVASTSQVTSSKQNTNVSPRAAACAFDRVCFDCEDERCELEAAISANRAAIHFLERVQRALVRLAGRPSTSSKSGSPGKSGSPKLKPRSSVLQNKQLQQQTHQEGISNEGLEEDDDSDYSVADALRDCEALRSRTGFAIQRRAIERAYDDCSQKILDELVADARSLVDAARHKTIPRSSVAVSSALLRNKQLKVKTRLFNSFGKRPTAASKVAVGAKWNTKLKINKAQTKPKLKVKREGDNDPKSAHVAAATGAGASSQASALANKSKAKSARRVVQKAKVSSKRVSEISSGESNVVAVVLRRLKAKLSALLGARSRFEPVWSARVREAFERRRAALTDSRVRRDATRFSSARLIDTLKARRSIVLTFCDRPIERLSSNSSVAEARPGATLDSRKRRLTSSSSSWGALFDDVGTLVQAVLRSTAFASDALRFAVDDGDDDDGDAVSARDRVEYVLKRIMPALFSIGDQTQLQPEASAKRARALRSTRLCSRNLISFFCDEEDEETTDDDQPADETNGSHAEAVDSKPEPTREATETERKLSLTNTFPVNVDWYVAVCMYQAVCERLRCAQRRLSAVELERRNAKKTEVASRSSLSGPKKRKMADRELNTSSSTKVSATDALFTYRRFIETLRTALNGSSPPDQYATEMRTLFAGKNGHADDAEDDEAEAHSRSGAASPFRFVYVLTLPSLVGGFVRALLRLVHGHSNIAATRALVSMLLARTDANAEKKVENSDDQQLVTLSILPSPNLRLVFKLERTIDEESDENLRIEDQVVSESAAEFYPQAQATLRTACEVDRFATSSACDSSFQTFMKRNLRSSVQLWIRECSRFEKSTKNDSSTLDEMSERLMCSRYFTSNLYVDEQLQYVHLAAPRAAYLGVTSRSLRYVPGTFSVFYRRGSLRRASARNEQLRKCQLSRLRSASATAKTSNLSSCFESQK